MSKIFVDVGCGNCDDLMNFWYDNRDYTYYAIDPSNNYHDRWEEIKKIIPNITFINKAAWVRDGNVRFYEERNENPQGSTLIKEKKGVGDMVNTVVEGFDFSKWIERFRNDYLVVLMDIEGAEYDVINKLIFDGNLTIIKKLFYESHAHKINDSRIKDLCSFVERELSRIRHFRLGGNDIVKDEYFGEYANNKKP